MKNRILIILVLLLAPVLSLWAIPAHPRPFALKLHDGTEVTVRAVGDESFHYLVTLDGTPVVKTNRGYELMPEKAEEMKAKYRQLAAKRNAPLMAEMMQKTKARHPNAGKDGKHKVLPRPDASKYRGKKDVLVLLVEFPNCKFTTSANQIYRKFNQVGYNDNGCTGSVHDYFYDNSCGQLDLSFDVEGPIMMDKGYEYYGANDKDGDDENAFLMVQEACGKAGIQNWSKYDNDGDGEVDQVCLVYAGFPESYYSEEHPEYIWPHRSYMYGWYPDGKNVIHNYLVTNELLADNFPDYIGTFCHEFSHILGLPDFYDANYAYDGLSIGMGVWDLMDVGSYNGPQELGENPTGYTGFERWFFGWMDFDVLDQTADVSLTPISKANDPHALVIYQDDRKDEFVVLENRQSDKWYKYTKDLENLHGLLAYRVCVRDDDVKNLWDKNKVNVDQQHQCMVVMTANNSYGLVIGTSLVQDRAKIPGQLFPEGSLYLDSLSHEYRNGHWLAPGADGSKRFRFSLRGIEEQGRNVTFRYVNHRQAIDPEQPDTGGEGDVITPTKPAKLTEVRYWVDNAEQATVISPRNYFTVDVNKLEYGMHTLYVLLFNEEDCGSEVYLKPFYKLPDTGGKYYEYWFDFDKKVTTISPSSTALMLDAKHLNVGFHTLYLRQRNNTYDSDVTTTMFYKSPNNGNSLKVVAIVDGEYHSQYSVPGDGTASTLTLNVSQLSTGFHLAQFVLLNDEGSQTDIHDFFFYKQPSHETLHTYNLIYRIDYGPETVASVTDAYDENVFLLDVTDLKRGSHSIMYKLIDNEGYVHEEGESNFYIVSDNGIVVIPDDKESNIYDLQGRPTNSGSRGIHIVNGKKILFR